jgi:hypothetical protein
MSLLASQLSERLPQFNPDAFRVEALVAADNAYDTLSSKGLDRDNIHKLQVCYEASSLVVNQLLENGHIARHEISSGEKVRQHSYVVVDTLDEGEMLIDPTWQQFLPKGSQAQAEIPRVLVGNRRSVISKAREYGVAESILKVWEKQSNNMSVEQQRVNDQEAEAQAETAESSGAWEKFLLGPK